MVLGLLLSALIVFALVVTAADAGTLRALEVYFDPARDSVFLPDDADPRRFE